MTLVTSRDNNKTLMLPVIKGKEKAVIKEFLLTIPKALKKYQTEIVVYFLTAMDTLYSAKHEGLRRFELTPLIPEEPRFV